MVVRFKEEVEVIPRARSAFGRPSSDEIDGCFCPDEANDNGASVSFLDMFGNDADTLDDSFFEALNDRGKTDDNDYFGRSFP
jgi:hypothetical protein